MDENKITDLAKSLSASCKQALKDSQLEQRINSPMVALIALTVWRAVIDGGDTDKISAWW